MQWLGFLQYSTETLEARKIKKKQSLSSSLQCERIRNWKSEEKTGEK